MKPNVINILIDRARREMGPAATEIVLPALPPQVWAPLHLTRKAVEAVSPPVKEGTIGDWDGHRSPLAMLLNLGLAAFAAWLLFILL